ncbi:MAG: carbohydrate porin [Phycisphaeraceae bacterium]|nr:carbohydrate porin [Phycisphaeraceae bacterium]
MTNRAGNVSGGRDQGFIHADNLGLDFHLDLEKIFGIDGASFLLNMSQRSGSSVSGVCIGNVFTVQQVFGGSTFHLIDAANGGELTCRSLSHFPHPPPPTPPHSTPNRLLAHQFVVSPHKHHEVAVIHKQIPVQMRFAWRHHRRIRTIQHA